MSTGATTELVVVTDENGNLAAVKPASSAALATDAALVVAVSPNNTVPVSAAALPLPAGAATEATLATRAADATLTGGTQRTRITDGTDEALVSGAGALHVDGSAVTQPVSAASLPLPTGAATEATLASRAAAAQLPGALVGGRLDVNVGAALPAGTNNIGDVDVLTLPAPLTSAGGGTEAAALRVTIANDSTGLLSVDDNGASLTVDSPQLPAALGSAVSAASLPVVVASDQVLPVSAASLPLPTGAASEATLATRAADATITARLGVLGQATMAASAPVVLASNQSAVPVSDGGGSLTVDGTVTADQGAPAAYINRWPVQHTDGTNSMPTGDAAARSIY
ncbi:MAG TPA: hypothetical protein VMW48_15350, partial [Vicinamibacterales bacterium]|nr:hypothetical protein [Vicinamibacterales bacterium]